MPRKPAKTRRSTAASARSTGNVTLADVAMLAGVSPITVSRVVNRPELVTAETLEHVKKVIERTGYVPNLLAGGLASRRSRLVAAVVPSITNAIFVDSVQAFTDRLWEAGYQVLLGLSGYPATREEALLGAVLSRRPDAILLTGINHSLEVRQRLLAARIPIVEMWDMTPTPIDMLVGFSHEKVGEAVARHLLAKGHLRLGLVTADDERALARRRGFSNEIERVTAASAADDHRRRAVDADAGAAGARAAARPRRRAGRGLLRLRPPRPRRARGGARPQAWTSRARSRSSASAASNSPNTRFPPCRA